VLQNDEVERPVQQKVFNAEEMIRTYLRIKKFLTTPPAVLSPVMKFPEVFILIAVNLLFLPLTPHFIDQLYGFLCFGADAHHLPLILFFVVFVNGPLTPTT
jgi:hypothetical protein